jgi:hypothetical protein
MKKDLEQEISFVELTIGKMIEQYNKCSAELLKLEIKQYKERLKALYDTRRRIRKATNGTRKVSR